MARAYEAECAPPLRPRASVRLAVGGVVALSALAVVGCGDAGDGVRVERSDSAGVELVVNHGEDRPLEWRLERVFELGGVDEGPEAFFNVGQGALAADGGELYVLDRGNHRVVVFDSAGEHVRTLSGRGGGPGELQWPQYLVVSGDGTLAIADIGQRGLVRITRDGEPLENRAVEGWMGGRVDRYGDGVLVEVGAGDREAPATELVHLAGGERTSVLTSPMPRLRPVDFGCVRIGGMSQLFAPSLKWAAGAGRIVANREAGYELEVFSDDALVRRVRRDVPARAATPELALQEVGDEYEVSFGGGGSCEVAPEKVVEERGVAEVIPALRRVAVAPDGTVWAQRYAVKGEEAAVDVFGPEGDYLGTLPPGAPFPIAFFGPDRFATTEKDELDVDHVVVYDVSRRAD